MYFVLYTFCVAYWNISLLEKHKSCICLQYAKHVQTLYLIRTNIWSYFARCKQTQDLFFLLLCVQYRHIPICNTIQYMYMSKTKHALLHHTMIYIGIGSINCMSSLSYEQREVSANFKLKINASAGNRTATYHFPACCFNHSVIGIVNDLL